VAFVASFFRRISASKLSLALAGSVGPVAQVQEEQVGGGERIVCKPRTRSASILDSVRAAELYQQFERQINYHRLNLYQTSLALDLKEVSGTQMIRYGQGGHYVRTRMPARSSRKIFTVSATLTMICRGDTRFLAGSTVENPKQDKQSFSRRSLHCAEPVTRGENLS